LANDPTPARGPKSGSVTIGVAGGTGSGKTTISNAILERLGQQHIAYLPHDAYYRSLQDMPRTDKEVVNFDHPDSFDTPSLVQHILQLQRGESVDVPMYDFSTHSPLERVRRIEPQPIILVEGILIFAEPALRELFDMRIFVDTDADIRFIRRLNRDVYERGRSVESIIHQYLTSVRPMHQEFVEPSKRYADVIIPEGGQNLVAIEMLAERIRSMINTHIEA
jgi:uridine kinase